MSIPVACATCGVKLKAPDAAAGRTLKCPQCRTAVVVPSPGPDKSAEAVQTTSPVEYVEAELAEVIEAVIVPVLVPSSCPECAYRHKIGEEILGKTVLCPQCQTRYKPKGMPQGQRSREEDIIIFPLTPEPDRSTQETAPSYKECPFCSEQIRATARKCKHCGETLDVVLRAKEEDRRAAHTRQDRRREVAIRDGPSSEPAASHSLGIASLVLGCMAFVLSLIPCLGILTMPLSGLGLLLGIVGWIVALSRNGHGIGFPIAGCFINIMALLMASFWLGLLKGVSESFSR
jgi:hypothetical protein